MWGSRPGSPRCNHSLRIELTRSGGYAGLTSKLGELDTSELPEEEAREIEGMVEKANVPELQAASPITGKGADRFQYDIAFEDENGRRELIVSEDKMSEALRSLVDRVKAAGSGA
jgi:hypothetical protein